ncbi:uracil-DNA glycosylase family protein [Elongatibacter sediminis]|uniref:Uracil-DNA glycosylase family protein n=1 Tax=Elongatibacter sediminis TaxID=3119006 RepID=A0AAW9R4Z3_9GAMM
MASSDPLKQIFRELGQAVGELGFGPPVTHVYNPLSYAREAVEGYLQLACRGPVPALFLGMNPGPWGMAQTGVPFGTISAARDWMGLDERVAKPADEHPKRPVLGFGVQREEVSGQRFWAWAQARYATPERFFSHFFVANYCPLMFMEASGRNRTPDKLPVAERRPLFAACDEALRRTVEVLRPGLVIGIGKFAEDRARAALDATGVRIGRILHPSPASPVANRGWQHQAEQQLADLGVEFE